MRIALRALAIALLVATLPACDGIGREIVDRIPPKGPPIPPCIKPPPSCMSEIRDVALSDEIPIGAERVSSAECACDTLGGDAGVARDAVLAGGSRDSGARDGGEYDGGERDGGERDGGDRDGEACSSDKPVGALSDGSCETVRVLLEPGVAKQVLHAPSLSRTNLEIASDTPVTLAIDHPQFTHVFVSLSGPITLQISDSVAFGNVGIVGFERDSGAPRVELTQVSADYLAIGADDREFEGTVVAARSDFGYSRVSADTIEFDSVHGSQIAISAGDLFAADTALTSTRLDVGRALFSASFLSQTHVDACNALMLIAVTFEGGELPPCSGEPLRAYSSNVSDAFVDGTIDSDNTTWTDTRFGMLEPTEMLGWGANLERVAFCAHAAAIRLGEDGNSMNCSTCVEGSFSAEPLCTVPRGGVDITNSLCEALMVEGDMVPDCEGPPAMRARVRMR